jgi:hypothetical protein
VTSAPIPAEFLAEARKVYSESMWDSPDISVCSCDCHGPSEANVEHHVAAIAAFGHAAHRRGRDEGIELRKAIATILDGFDKGIFVRDISGDGDSAWPVKFVPYALALGKLTKALKQEGGE